MYAILTSALWTVLSFLLRSVLIKFVVFFALFFITTEFIGVLTPLLPDASALNNSMAGIPSAVWYFLDIFNISTGLPTILTAFVTRFVIRRIPVIG